MLATNCRDDGLLEQHDQHTRHASMNRMAPELKSELQRERDDRQKHLYTVCVGKEKLEQHEYFRDVCAKVQNIDDPIKAETKKGEEEARHMDEKLEAVLQRAIKLEVQGVSSRNVPGADRLDNLDHNIAIRPHHLRRLAKGHGTCGVIPPGLQRWYNNPICERDVPRPQPPPQVQAVVRPFARMKDPVPGTSAVGDEVPR